MHPRRHRSTPQTLTAVQEGVFIHAHGSDPYDGGVFYHVRLRSARYYMSSLPVANLSRSFRQRPGSPGSVRSDMDRRGCDRCRSASAHMDESERRSQAGLTCRRGVLAQPIRALYLRGPFVNEHRQCAAIVGDITSGLRYVDPRVMPSFSAHPRTRFECRVAARLSQPFDSLPLDHDHPPRGFDRQSADRDHSIRYLVRSRVNGIIPAPRGQLAQTNVGHHVSDPLPLPQSSLNSQLDRIGPDPQRRHVVVLFHRDVRPLPALLPWSLSGTIDRRLTLATRCSTLITAAQCHLPRPALPAFQRRAADQYPHFVGHHQHMEELPPARRPRGLDSASCLLSRNRVQ